MYSCTGKYTGHLWPYSTLTWSLMDLFTAFYWLGLSSLRNLNDIRPGYSVLIGQSIFIMLGISQGPWHWP